MARIGFDGLAIAPDGKGHARTQRHAAEALAARGEHEVLVFVRHPVEVEGAKVVVVGEGLALDWELRGMPRAARRHGLDAMLTLSERLPLIGGPPTVVWLFESPLHRIAQTRLAGGASLKTQLSDRVTDLLWKRSLRRAAHVAMGSAATEAEVLEAIPELAGRTSVVYPALAPGFGSGAASEDRGRYVFHLGSSDPRDNTATAVEAARLAGVRLLVAGGSAAVPDGASHVELLGRVSDAELLDLYRGAAAFVDPTLYEGFGYGVLEAMACGAPVVASDTTSIPEVTGDAALLCDPRSPQAFADALRRVLEEPDVAESLREQGLRRATRFTWAATATGLSEALARALS